MRKSLARMIISFCCAGAFFISCAGMQSKPTEADFKAPVVKLVSFEVPQYDDYWYYAKSVKPTKGKEDDRGAPLPMSFLFSIENPNPYPVLLEGITYSVAFDKEFEVMTTNNNDAYWIPAGKTDHVRLNTMITVRSALFTLLLPNAIALKSKGWDAWDTLERWWKDVPLGTAPVTVKNASFSFTAGGIAKVVPFEGSYP